MPSFRPNHAGFYQRGRLPRIVEKHSLCRNFIFVRELFACGALEETPKSDVPSSCARAGDDSVEQIRIEAAASEAAALVLTSKSITPATIGTTTRRQVSVGRLLQLRMDKPRTCLISGGEVTVKVTGEGGVGGRNQQFAPLALARLLEKTLRC